MFLMLKQYQTLSNLGQIKKISSRNFSDIFQKVKRQSVIFAIKFKSNGLVVKALNSQSRGAVFRTTG